MDPDIFAHPSGYRTAKSITQHFAKSFYFASLFLPKNLRPAVYSIYAVCRLSDDSVDRSAEQKEKSLTVISQKIDRAYSDAFLDDPLLELFRDTVKRFRIPHMYFEELISGMRMDLNIRQYSTFSELYHYCYKVAGIVGLIMLKIFGHQGDDPSQQAIDLGVAMQLTNILRDIREDYDMGRIYLPQEDLDRFGVAEKDISSHRISEGFKDMMRFEIARARTYFEESAQGIRAIKNRRSRFVVWVMKETYAGILGQIERQNYNVFSRRARVGLGGKVRLAGQILVSGKYL